VQARLPVWVGVGGTPESFARAGVLGLPLMVAIIGGTFERFRPLVDLYREAGRRAGHAPEDLRVGIGGPDSVVAKAHHVDQVLGGIDRLTFQMTNVLLPHAAMLHSIDRLATDVAPRIRTDAAAARENVSARPSP